MRSVGLFACAVLAQIFAFGWFSMALENWPEAWPMSLFCIFMATWLTMIVIGLARILANTKSGRAP